MTACVCVCRPVFGGGSGIHGRSAFARRAGPSQLVGHPRRLARPDCAAGGDGRRHPATSHRARRVRPRRPAHLARDPGRAHAAAGSAPTTTTTTTATTTTTTTPPTTVTTDVAACTTARPRPPAPPSTPQAAAPERRPRPRSRRPRRRRPTTVAERRGAGRSHADRRATSTPRSRRPTSTGSPGRVRWRSPWSGPGAPTSPWRSAARAGTRAWAGRPPWPRRCRTPAGAAWPR